MKRSNPGQKEKFIDKAKELGCDEDEGAFERKLRDISKLKDKSGDREK